MALYDETEVDEVEDSETSEETESETTETDASDNGVDDRIKQLEDNRVLDQMMNDPDVQKVLDLKRSGKSVEVGEPVVEEEKSEFDVDPDDPAAELLKKIGGMMDNKLGKLKDRLHIIEGIAQRAQSNEVNNEIDRLKTKHRDFDTYKDSMVKLSNENAGLNVEELYTMAKMRAGKLDIVQPSTFSEKGTTQPRRMLKKAGSTTPRGRQGFNKIVRAALDGLDLDSLE